jgi:chromosome segregation ATPase
LESDVPKKKNDMIKKLRQLNQFLDEFALDVTGDEQHLSSITEKLKRVTAETKKLNQNLSNVTEEFLSLCEERERRFNECLGVINGEIEKFCAVGLKGKAKGLLKATEKNEQCQHSVQYTWTNEDEIEEHVTDLNRNYEAAFAMLLGLIK